MMKAVFFDLDGTLIDSDPYWVRSQETLVRSCGGEWSDALADALQGAAFPETVRLLRGAGVDWDGDAIVRHLSDEVLRMEKERLPWIEGVRDVLSGLAAAHVPAVLVTGSPREIVENVMAQAPKGAFVGYVCGNDDVTPKPDPAPYWRAASMVGCWSVSGFRGFQARVDGGSGVGRDGGRGHRSCSCGYERQWAVR